MFEAGLLKDKVILVTGGGTGLGRSMVERFVALGAKVAISGRRLEVLEHTARDLGDNVLAVQCDVRDPEQVSAMFNQTIQHFGTLDVLLNNAAGNFISPTERLSHRAVDSVLNIVLHGSMYCTLEAGKYWIEQKKKGNVLSIVTTYAQSGSGYVVPSAVAKAGVVTMTKSLAAEWGKYGIRLNAIAPGPFPTEGAWERLMPSKDFEQQLKARIPLGRYGEHIELANLAAFLVSEFSGFITGDVMFIDGGEAVWNAGEFNILDAIKPEQWDAIAAAMRKK